ncbi:amidase family protein [Streptomyces sp. NPDC005492]|uniref:amidase n=1 Tax=Streptomyces sp. NPDC005492 TaxID=3156883 RepID=UPI0033A268BE
MHIHRITSFESLRTALISGETTVQEATESSLSALDAAKELQAVRHTRLDEVRREAAEADRVLAREGERAWVTRPLLGLTLTVKELTAVAGLPHSRGREAPAEVARQDAPAVHRLRAAGALILGSTTSPQGGWCGAGLNGNRPPTANPWNTTLTAGGSSGGAAAAVAVGFGLAAIGTDGAGSVRIPASFCGVVGHKPTFGVVPYVPVSPEGLSHLGTLTSTVDDAAALVRAMAGPDPADPAGKGLPGQAAPGVPSADAPLRIAWTPSLGMASPDPAVLAACQAAVDRLADAGHLVEQVDPPAADGYPALATILATEEARTADPDDDDRLHPVHREVVRWGRSLTAVDLATAIGERARLRVAYDALLEAFDVLVTPTVPVLPFDVGLPAPADFLDQGATRWLAWTPNTYTFNLSRQPATTVPVGRTATGLPIGLQVVAARHRDHAALRIASEAHGAAVAAAAALPLPAFDVGASIGH